MKAKYTGTIQEVSKKLDEVEMKLSFRGDVDDFKQEAKKTSMEIVLRLKPIVADHIKLGTKFTIVLSTEDEELDAGTLLSIVGPLSGGLL